MSYPKTLQAEVVSSGWGQSAGLRIGARVTGGLTSMIDRSVDLKIHVSTIASLIDMAIQHGEAVALADHLRRFHPPRSWRGKDEQAHDAKMRAIADLIDGGSE